MGGWAKSSKRSIKPMLRTYELGFKDVGFVRSFDGRTVVSVVKQPDGGNNGTLRLTTNDQKVHLALDRNPPYELDHIYYYEDNKLVRSVDLREKGGPHYHYWEKDPDGKPVRKKHSKKNLHTDLTEEDLYYIKEGEKFAKYFFEEENKKKK